MASPIVIFLITSAGGVLLAARWLPEPAGTRNGTIAFWATCGLAGAGLALLALHVYEIIRLLNNAGPVGNTDPDIVATGITETLSEAGPILGLAAAVYLLAVARGEQTTHERSQAAGAE
jgi:hypothetical protein